MPRPELVAHRGLAARFPENTLAAFRAALEAGARWLETDVQLSQDGVPFLFHDRGLQRLTGLRGPLADRTALELGSVAAAYPERFGSRFARERVARLEELVALVWLFGDVRVFVELKRASLERFGADLVLARVLAELEPLGERAIPISFSLDALAAVRRAGARVAVYEVADGATARALAARGVELLETFDVEKLAEELR